MSSWKVWQRSQIWLFGAGFLSLNRQLRVVQRKVPGHFYTAGIQPFNMKNDIAEPSAPLGPSDLRDMQTLSEFQVDRPTTELWAMRDCKFLVFDDTDIQTNGYDSDDEEGMLKYAMELSKEQTDDEEDKFDVKGKGKQVQPQSPESAEDQDRDVDGSRCQICSALLEFPTSRKTRKFRIFKPSDAFPELLAKDQVPQHASICCHYLAVSYCWPEPKTDSQGNILQEDRSYQVRDLSGTQRKNRALDNVLDRAVEVANACGLRMIWIDQECLPQPTETSSQEDKDEQQVGVQAMDILYYRATRTAGLHTVEISSQAQLDALQTLSRIGNGKQADRPFDMDRTLVPVVEILEVVNRDRWYTRAWVVQEALSAGDNLLLVFRLAAGLSSPSHFRPDSRHTQPPHSLDNIFKNKESGVVCIPVPRFREMVNKFKSFLQDASWESTGSALTRSSHRVNQYERVTRAIAATNKLHPMPSQASSLEITVGYGGSYHRKKNILDAAGALSLLKSRHCRDQEDRVAILANMCGYEIRLDTNHAATNCASLRPALLALSLLNGDLSLLVPEVYPTPSTSTALRTLRNQDCPYWLSHFDTEPNRIEHVRALSLTASLRLRPRSCGLKLFHFPAYLWTVDAELDLTPIKIRWARTWSKMKCLGIEVDNPKDESAGNYQSRVERVRQHFANREIMHMAHEELFHTGFIADDSPVWNGIDYTGIEIKQVLIPDRVQASPEMQGIIATIFFDVLRFLFFQRDVDPRAIGVANSIWQSMRVDAAPSHYDDVLPDEVSEALFNHPNVVETPFKTLQWDKAPGDQYSQVWLIDRIMLNGTLWVGRYVRSYTRWAVASRPNTPPPSQVLEENSASMTLEMGESSRSRTSQNTLSAKPKRTILDRQVSRQLLANVFKHRLHEPAAPKKHSSAVLSVGSVVEFSECAGYGTWTLKEEDRRAENLVSVFDVDGPCLVATPYDSSWEVLPHPELRTMSVCWVVEGVPDPSPNDTSAVSEEKHSRNESPEPPDAEIFDPAFLVDMRQSREDKPVPSYRVLEKVKGMWQLMDTPLQTYLFT